MKMKNNEMLVKAMKALAVASDALVEYVEAEEAKNVREPYHDYGKGTEEVVLPEDFALTHLVHKATELPCCVVQKVLDLAEFLLAEDDELIFYDLAPLIRERTGLCMKDIKAVLATADKIMEEEKDDEQD